MLKNNKPKNSCKQYYVIFGQQITIIDMSVYLQYNRVVCTTLLGSVSMDNFWGRYKLV